MGSWCFRSFWNQAAAAVPDFLLVDEVQDVNGHQYDVIKLLVKQPVSSGDAEGQDFKPRCVVTLVGDERQTIFGFHGAKLDTM